MCGIVGYISSAENQEKHLSVPILIGGLLRIQHRGYDAWGICISSDTKGFSYHKSAKGIEPISMLTLEQKIKDGELSGDFGIAHTRWATTGANSETNAHPQFSCDGRIAIVHNGIVENYQELKEKLRKQGHVFKSETDTEVIPHLVEEYAKTQEFPLAFRKAVKELRGTYAIAAVCYSHRAIFLAKKENPLIISMYKKDNVFISSDLIPIPANFDKLIELKDGDTAMINGKKIHIWNNEEEVTRKAKKADLVSWRRLSVDPFGDKLTLPEIEQQRYSMKHILEQNDDKLERAIRTLKKANQIILTGSGSSYNAAALGEYLFRSLGLRAIAVPASSLASYEKSIDAKTVIMPISQSGETMDIIDGIKQVIKTGARLYSIVNVPLSSIGDLSNMVLPAICGPEFSVIATKSFTAQQIILYKLYYGLRGDPLYGRDILSEVIEKTSDLISRFVASDKMRELAEIIWTNGNDFIPIIGAGPSFSTALETSMKIDELTEIPTRAYLSQEFKHGHLQLIQPNVRKIAAIAIIPDDEDSGLTAIALKEIRIRGGYAAEITSKARKDTSFSQIIIPDISDAKASQLLAAVAAQIFAYRLGEIHHAINGGSIDRPNNLAKSLTVK